MQKQILRIVVLFVIGVSGRLLPHPPNFTPLEAVSLFGGAWIRPFWLSLTIPLGIMAMSDALLGWHNLWPFTWGAMAIGTILGRFFLVTSQIFSLAGLALLQSTLFFLITNFGVWIGGSYGYTFKGLIACYIAAIPFYHYQALGALFYSILFWMAEYVVYRKLSPVIK